MPTYSCEICGKDVHKYGWSQTVPVICNKCKYSEDDITKKTVDNILSDFK